MSDTTSDTTLQLLEAEAYTRRMLYEATERLNAYDLVAKSSTLTVEQTTERENILAECETFRVNLRLLAAEIDRRDNNRSLFGSSSR